MLTKSLIATVLAATLAFGGTATPVRADRNDTIRTVVGIAALALIAKEIARQQERDRAREKAARNPPPPPPVRRDDRWDSPNDRYRDWNHYKPRHPARPAELPAVCAFEISGHRGPSTVVGKACLEEQGVRGRLPEWCEFTVRTRFGARQVYGANCLRESGYRIGADRRR